MAIRPTERQMNLAVFTLGVAAALWLLDQQVPLAWRILPWLLVFGYPLWRMVHARRAGLHG